jgi:hypothetical protein
MARSIISEMTARYLGKDLSKGTRLPNGDYDFGEITDYDPNAFAFAGEPRSPVTPQLVNANYGQGPGTTAPNSGPPGRPGSTLVPPPGTNPNGLTNPVGRGPGIPNTTNTLPPPSGNGPPGRPGSTSLADLPLTGGQHHNTSTSRPNGNPTGTPAFNNSATAPNTGGLPTAGDLASNAASAAAASTGQANAAAKNGPQLKGGLNDGVPSTPLPGSGVNKPPGQPDPEKPNGPQIGYDPVSGRLTLNGEVLQQGDRRMWGRAGRNITQYQESGFGQGQHDPRYYYQEGVQNLGDAGDVPIWRLRPEYEERLKGRIQLQQPGVGSGGNDGYSEVIDWKLVEYDEEFGLVTPPSNVKHADPNNDHAANAALIAWTIGAGAMAGAAGGAMAGTAGAEAAAPTFGNVVSGGSTTATSLGSTVGAGAAGTLPQIAAGTAGTQAPIVVTADAIPSITAGQAAAAAGTAAGVGAVANQPTGQPTSNANNQPNNTNTNQPTNTTEPPPPPANTPTGLQQIWNGVRYVWNGVKWVSQAMGLYNTLTGNGNSPSSRNNPGGLGNLFENGISLYDANRNRQQYENDVRNALDRGDYNREYRPGYLSRLRDYELDPEAALSDPTFQAGRERSLHDRERKLNSRGMHMSGNEEGELLQLGREIDYKHLDQLKESMRRSANLGDPGRMAVAEIGAAGDFYRARNNRSAGPGAGLLNGLGNFKIGDKTLSQWMDHLLGGNGSWEDLPSEARSLLDQFARDRNQSVDDYINNFRNTWTPPDFPDLDYDTYDPNIDDNPDDEWWWDYILGDD